MNLAESDPSSALMNPPDASNESALLSWIHQFAPYGIITLDAAYHVQIWNHWMEAHSPIRGREAIGRDIFELFPELIQRRLASHFERALKGQATVLSTALHHYLLPLPSPLGKTGAFMQQTARIAPLLRDGKVCGIVVVIEDVTQRETQAEILRLQHRRSEILSWALAHLLKTEEPRKMVRQLFLKIAEHLDFDTFLLFLNDIDTGQLHLHSTGGIPEEGEKELAHHPLFAATAKTPDIAILNHLQIGTDPKYSILKNAHVSAAIAIPLYANDRSLGLLCFGSWSREVIAEDETELLKTISQYLSIAVDRENTIHQLSKARVELSNHAQTLEIKVKERTSQLRQTVSELEAFSYTLAHDLKAPVRGMNGYCQILLEDYRDKLPPDALVIIEKMARTPKRMEALIKDLLKFSELSRHDVVLSKVEIGPLLEDILAMRLPAVRAATKIEAPLHPVLAHEVLLHQILSNLIDNAIKFVAPNTLPKITISTEIVSQISQSTRSGQLLFNSTEPPVKETVKSPDQRIRIWVRDEGIGIPPEAHKKIFGIFERGPFAERYEGNGMGLAIVAQAMQIIGGTCGLAPSPPQGSHFWLELPAA